ncbi:putative SNF2 family helicase/ATPase [Tuber indicum]|nr:putative SNF2 family helicase/ATPase [Tuber indicum]
MSVVDGLNVTLLPHQIRGLAFLLTREEGKARGGILADDMGLGKTIQSISLILSHPHPNHPLNGSSSALSPQSKKAAAKLPSDLEKGTLVVAPLALIKQWEAEIARRTTDSHRMRVCVHHGPSRARDPSKLRRYDVVITTYDVVRSEHKDSSFAEGSDGHGQQVGCFGLRWWRIILDEAHTIKNRLAKGSLAACALRARYRWCLTGTPLQNKIEELQSLIKFLRVAPFDDLAVWKEQIARPMTQGREGVALERLKVVLGAIMLRRTKDVLRKDGEKLEAEGGQSRMKLPARKMEKVAVHFDAREKEFYEKLETRTEENLEKMLSGFGAVGGKGLGGVNMTSALLLLLRLRQACNHPQLVAGKIHKDKESGLGLATPRKRSSKPATAVDDVLDDELAGLLGGLSVDAKKCDVCFSDLTREESQRGEARCAHCRADLDELSRSAKKAKRKEKIKAKKVNNRRRPIVLDSDDERDEPEPEGHAEEDDEEDDEGSQAEEGTDTSDEDDDIRPRTRKIHSLIDDEAEEASEEESEEDYPSPTISTKIRYLLAVLRKELKSKNKTIVFSQFTSMLDLIEPFLHRNGIAFTRYDGSMKNDDREASLRRLRGEGEYAPKPGKEDRGWCGVLLCSLKCGALGLNLTAACRVVILEPFWNPFVEEQAIDRVHRIGQETDVVVYKITVAGSVEERILQLQDQKRELAKAAFGDGDGGLGNAKAAKLSMKDILYLFRRDAEGVNSSAEARGLGARTKILGKGPSRGGDDERGVGYTREVPGRYVIPSAEEEREKKRVNEISNPYGRR